MIFDFSDKWKQLEKECHKVYDIFLYIAQWNIISDYGKNNHMRMVNGRFNKDSLLLTDGCVWSHCTEETQLTPVSIHNVTKHSGLGGETGSARVLQIT